MDNPNDPSDAADDSDGDGVSNLDGYKENSDPTDSVSVPRKVEKEEGPEWDFEEDVDKVLEELSE